jgi:hypothetical protein
MADFAPPVATFRGPFGAKTGMGEISAARKKEDVSFDNVDFADSATLIISRRTIVSGRATCGHVLFDRRGHTNVIKCRWYAEDQPSFALPIRREEHLQ